MFVLLCLLCLLWIGIRDGKGEQLRHAPEIEVSPYTFRRVTYLTLNSVRSQNIKKHCGKFHRVQRRRTAHGPYACVCLPPRVPRLLSIAKARVHSSAGSQAARHASFARGVTRATAESLTTSSEGCLSEIPNPCLAAPPEETRRRLLQSHEKGEAFSGGR